MSCVAARGAAGNLGIRCVEKLQPNGKPFEDDRCVGSAEGARDAGAAGPEDEQPDDEKQEEMGERQPMRPTARPSAERGQGIGVLRRFLCVSVPRW